jgi:hypothetical protein
MATFAAGIADTDGIQMTENSVLFDVSGGTLDNSNVVQVNWDSTVFTGQEGKQRLVAAMELLTRRIQTAKLWPITAAA